MVGIKHNIYLLRAYKGDGTSLLKLGYAKDIPKRFNSYKAHNPGIEFIGSWYKEGGIQFERKVHSMIEASYRSEWYSEDKMEVILGYLGPSNSTHLNESKVAKVTWEEKVNTAINALSMDNALIYKMVLRNGTPEQILISQGLELFSPLEVANTKSKKELSDKINEYRTREAKSSIGVALSKKGLANSWISSESAKEMLKSLFQLYGYESTAKGSSIGEFFNSTASKSVSKGGKAVKGYSLGSAKYSITES